MSEEQRDKVEEDTSDVFASSPNPHLSEEEIAKETADNIARNTYYRANENRRTAMTLAVEFMKDQSGIGPNEVCQVAFIFEQYLNDIQVPNVRYL